MHFELELKSDIYTYRRLAEKAFEVLRDEKDKEQAKSVTVDRIHVLPKLVAESPCCVYKPNGPDNPLTEFRIIMYFTVVSLVVSSSFF